MKRSCKDVEKLTEAEWKALDFGAMDEDEFVELVLKRVKSAPPALTDAQVKSIEEQAQIDGVTRRIALAILMRPDLSLVNSIESDREAAVAFADCLARMDGYISRMKILAEMANSVKTKMMVALATRHDMREVIAEGKRSAFSS